MSESKIPKPRSTDIIIVNPLYGKEDTMEEELKAIPESEREAYIKENFNHLFHRVKVTKVGLRVPEMSGYDEITEVMTSPGALSNGIFVNDEKHVIIRERDILAYW